MSASRYDPSTVFPEFRVDTPQSCFSVPLGAVRIRQSGMEFRAPSPLALWSEMSVVLQLPALGEPVRCTGVVVACDGNRHSGYAVAILFLGLPRGTERQLQLAAGAAWV